MTSPEGPRRTVQPSPLTGWNPAEHTVQVAFLKRRYSSGRTEYAVYLDGEHVGFAVSRREGRQTAWDYQRGGDSLDHTTSFVYGFTSRRMAVEHLFDAVQRGTTR